VSQRQATLAACQGELAINRTWPGSGSTFEWNWPGVIETCKVLFAGYTIMMMERNRIERHRKLDPAILADIVAKIVKVAKPETIILFGSAARGQMGPNSDVDLLVVKSGRFHRRRLAQKIYMRMEGASEALDIIVVTPEDVQRYRDTPWLVIAPALKEGVVVYAA
jgi:predicted nucleotidyltransferase